MAWFATMSTRPAKPSRSSSLRKPSWYLGRAPSRILAARNGGSRYKQQSSSNIAIRRRMLACSSKTSCASALLRQHSFKKLQRPRIVRLPEPEHGLLSHCRIPIVLRDFDEFWHAFLFRQLAERKDRFFLHFRVRVVVDSPSDRAHGFLPRLLREPEKRLSAHVRTGVVVCHANHFIQRSSFMADGKRKCHVCANLRTGIRFRYALQGSQSRLAACGSHPKCCLPPQSFTLLRRRKGFKRPVGRCIRMKRDCCQRAVAKFALPVLFNVRAAYVSCQERHALWRLDSRQPDERQAACVQRAIF